MTRPEPGRPDEIGLDIRRILAPNPSPMTHWGTNTYLLGTRDVTVLDPGPDDPRHLAAILAATSGGRIARIVVTHAHADHSALAQRLARATGAEVLGFGPAEAGRPTVMQALAGSGLAGGGEGVDRGFRPDRAIGDGGRLETEAGVLQVMHTPGHFAGHLSFLMGDVLFAGDHLMEWSTTLISPPDGDLPGFLQSCATLAATGARICHPGHGAPVTDPAGRLGWLVAHRRDRDLQIMAALDDGPATAPDIASRVYADLPPALGPAAARNVLAHLIAAVTEGRATALPELSETAVFARA